MGKGIGGSKARAPFRILCPSQVSGSLMTLRREQMCGPRAQGAPQCLAGVQSEAQSMSYVFHFSGQSPGSAFWAPTGPSG